MIDGFSSYAPELAREGGGFKPDFFERVLALLLPIIDYNVQEKFDVKVY